jgi:3-methyladenine DNA glycosylase AlkD
LAEIVPLLESPIHEQRLTALLLLVRKFEKGSVAQQKEIYEMYLGHTRYINNWDLVDLSAPNIVGKYLLDKDRSILDKLVHSGLLWERRISVLATAEFIRQRDFQDCLKLCVCLLQDKEDLIHKATGWMLREIYKKDPKPVISFLDKYGAVMPRTMLRYAIEKLPKNEQAKYLAIKKLP